MFIQGVKQRLTFLSASTFLMLFLAIPSAFSQPVPLTLDTPVIGPPPSTLGKIVYVSDRDGSKEIYMMDEFGAHQTRLTAGDFGNWAPSWSPLGNNLVFYSNRDGNHQIYSMLNDGNDQRHLRVTGLSETDPAFSPSADKIAFISTATGDQTLMVMNADGSNVRQLTPKESGCQHPSWSPDGLWIAYQKKSGLNKVIAVIAADGKTESKILFKGEYDCESPSWSPLGDMIAYVKTKAIWVKETKQITTFSNILISKRSDKGEWSKPWKITFKGNNTHPAWYPDGRRLVFQSDRNGYWKLYQSDREGKNQRKLIQNTGGMEQSPSVSPDGKRIAFSYYIYQASHLALYDPQSGLMSVVPNPKFPHLYPHWAATSDQFVYTGFSGTNGLITKASISGVTLATEEVHAPGDQLSPLESADQRYYVFSFSKNGSGQITLLERGTKKWMNLSNNKYDERNPALSQDGTQVYFESNRGGGAKYQVYRMNLDGTFPTLLTDGVGNNLHPVPSPDGNRVVFYSDRDGNAEVYTLEFDTHTLKRLTDSKDWDGDPVWSYDGSQVLFVSNRDKNYQIYKMNADGTSLINLSNNPSNETQPSWR